VTEQTTKEAQTRDAIPRRSFTRRALAVVIGGVTGLVPALVGLASFLNPLRKSVQARQRPDGFDAEGFVKVTRLEALAGESPGRFQIIANRKDAWNTFPKEPIGAVYVQKVSDTELRVFNVECPHAGCSVDYKADKRGFLCPCHNSLFAQTGKRSETSPSPRDLDSLEYKIQDGDVWVKFEKFKAGVKEKHAT